MIEFKCTRNGGKTLNQMNWPQEFFRYLLVEKGYSDKTKEANEEDISDFFEFLKSSGDENYRQIDHRDVRVYLSVLYDKKHLNTRSEEHTSELQSRFDLVCRLLLEKKKKI